MNETPKRTKHCDNAEIEHDWSTLMDRDDAPQEPALDETIAEIERKLAKEPQSEDLNEELAYLLFDRAISQIPDGEDETQVLDLPDVVRLRAVLDRLPDERVPIVRAMLAMMEGDTDSLQPHMLRWSEELIEAAIECEGDIMPGVLIDTVILTCSGQGCFGALAELWSKRAPDLASGWVMRAVAAEERGELDDTLDHCCEALTRDSSYWPALWIRAGTHYRRRDFEAARSDYEALIGNEDAWATLVESQGAWLLARAAWTMDARGKPEAAAALWQRCLELEPQEARHQLNLALSLDVAGDHEAALGLLAGLERSGRLSRLATLHRIRILRSLGQRRNADEALHALTRSRTAGAMPAERRPERVQACIHAYSFPRSLADFEAMLAKRSIDATWFTDLDEVLQHDTDDVMDGGWDATAPKWIGPGDVYLLYHTRSALSRAEGLLKRAEGSTDRRRLPIGMTDKVRQMLGHALVVAEVYGGSIFGWARVGGNPYSGHSEGLHFGGRIFVDLDHGGAFGSPLPYDVIRDHVAIRPASTITRLEPRSFQGLRDEIERRNPLPAYLARVEVAETGFVDVDAETWADIVCRPGVAFIHEVQVRAYLLDYFLRELKDPRSPLLEECRCIRGREFTGTADYFVKVNDVWLPVEAKINMTAERDILGQVRKYLGADVAVPTIRLRKGQEIAVDRPKLGLIGDGSGIYVVGDGGLIGCEHGKPWLPRTEMGRPDATGDLRAFLERLCRPL